MNSYEAKQEARRARLEARAERLAQEGNATHARAREMASAIPFGQPILVGHHSEKRDRNYRKRYCALYDKSAELQKAAGEAAARADSVGRGGVSGDDPDAVDKLREQLPAMRERRDMMVKANKLVRKKDMAGLLAMGFTEVAVARLFVPDFAGRLGFPAYELTNLGANIRRIEQRIAHLEKQAAVTEAEPYVERMVGDVKVVEDRESNRLRLVFPGKPDAAMRTKLKSRGFRWAPSEGAWQMHLSNAARWAAQWVLGEVAA